MNGPVCSLDDRALAEQLGRFERIGGHAVSSSRAADEVTVVLDRELDDALLAEALAIERACCPFFRLDWDEAKRELRIGAARENAQAVDLLAAALRV